MSQKNATINNLENTLDLYLVKKAPFQIPSNIKEALVRFGPWLIIVFMIMTLPAVLWIFGLATIAAPFTTFGGPGYTASFTLTLMISAIATGAAIVLELMALPGLFARKIIGWRYVYWSSLISIAASLLTGNIGGAILGGIISLYILFQIKSFYK